MDSWLSTGEEAYSLAILMCKQLTARLKHTVLKIFATDIDAVALVHAGKGIFSSSIVKDISAERFKKYF